jgi:hypothetical protein
LLISITFRTLQFFSTKSIFIYNSWTAITKYIERNNNKEEKKKYVTEERIGENREGKDGKK